MWYMGGGGMVYGVGRYGVWGGAVWYMGWGGVLHGGRWYIGAEMGGVKLCDCVPCDVRSNSDEWGGDSLLLLLNLWL